MNRALKQIISIFFLISGICFPPAVPAAINVVPGIVLENDESGYDQEYLRAVARQLDRYARMAKLKRSRKMLTVICGKGKYCGFYRGDRLYLPGNANLWQCDINLRRKIVAFIASHRFGFNIAGSTGGVAPWILYGLESEIAAAQTSGRFFVSNRDYRFLSGVCAASGAMPDFAAMCRMGEIVDPVMRELAGEQARLLLSIIAANGKIGELFQRICAGERADCFVDFYASGSDAQKKLAAAGFRLLWTSYHPMPAELALKRIPALQLCMIPRADKKGDPTTDFIQCSWTEFAAALETPRRDHLELRKNFAAGFTELGRMLNSREAAICYNLAGSVMDLGSKKHEDAVKNFSLKVKELEAALRKRIADERYLRQVLLLNIPVPDNFKLLFDAVKSSNISGSREEIRFLQQTINDYLQ